MKSDRDKRLDECADEILKDSKRDGESLYTKLAYPKLRDKITSLTIKLEDVRAADDIRVSYDFARNGWKIEQAAIFSWDADDNECDPEWAEVAFVQAWAREVKCCPQCGVMRGHVKGCLLIDVDIKQWHLKHEEDWT